MLSLLLSLDQPKNQQLVASSFEPCGEHLIREGVHRLHIIPCGELVRLQWLEKAIKTEAEYEQHNQSKIYH